MARQLESLAPENDRALAALHDILKKLPQAAK